MSEENDVSGSSNDSPCPPVVFQGPPSEVWCKVLEIPIRENRRLESIGLRVVESLHTADGLCIAEMSEVLALPFAYVAAIISGEACSLTGQPVDQALKYKSIGLR